MPELELKYLFEAKFEDGSLFEQPVNNRYSKHDENAEHNPSAFRDVMDREDELVEFSLVGDGHRYSVNLKTGHFTVDGAVIHIHDQFDNPHNEKLTLIYFRETVKEFDQNTFIDKDGNLVTEEGETRHFVKRYFIGWKFYRENGEKVERTLAVS